MKTIALFLLVPFTVFSQPPIPKLPMETKMALAITMTANTNSEAFRLSSYFLKGIISPTYYSNAIHNIYNTAQMSNIVSSANITLKTAVAIAPVVITNTLPLGYSNPMTAYRVAIGTSNWNVIDSAPTNNYLPAYNIQSTTSVQTKNAPFTNIISVPAGSRGLTNKYTSTNQERIYRVQYAQ
jgi:hypothetical protein